MTPISQGVFKLEPALFNKDVLAANKITGSPKELILEYLRKLPEKELASLVNQVKAFLFKESGIGLILKAPLYVERFLTKLYNEEYTFGQALAITEHKLEILT